MPKKKVIKKKAPPRAPKKRAQKPRRARTAKIVEVAEVIEASEGSETIEQRVCDIEDMLIGLDGRVSALEKRQANELDGQTALGKRIKALEADDVSALKEVVVVGPDSLLSRVDALESILLEKNDDAD